MRATYDQVNRHAREPMSCLTSLPYVSRPSVIGSHVVYTVMLTRRLAGMSMHTIVLGTRIVAVVIDICMIFDIFFETELYTRL